MQFFASRPLRRGPVIAQSERRQMCFGIINLDDAAVRLGCQLGGAVKIGGQSMSLRRSAIALVAPLFVLPLAGCAAIRSDPIDISTGVSRPGVEYSAPKGLLRVQLFEQDSVLALEISEPIIVGDPNASYVVNGSAGLLANQEYRLVVEPQTRLLTYINSRSEGQAGTILQNLARSAAGLGEATRDENNFGPGPRRIVYQRVVDPFDYPNCDFGSSCTFGPLAADLRRAALAYLGCERANRREAAPCPDLQDANFFAISLTPLFRVAPPSRESRQGQASDCRRSICYRAPAPYALSLRVGAHTDISEIVSFPNEAPVIGLDIPAGVFADANARVELFQGMPARYVVDRENELVAITLLPMDVLKAGFSAVSEVLQLRVNYNTDRINMIQSDRRLANERSADAPPPGQGLIGDAAGPRDENGGASPAAATSDGEAPWSDDFLALSVEDVTTRGSALPAESLFSIALDGRAPNGGADPAARPAHGADLNDDD